MSCLRELPIFVFAYTCHQNVISITNELERPTTGRALASVSAAVNMAVAAYLVLAFAGYLTYGDEVKSDVLENYPEQSLLVGIARLAVSLIVTLCYPLQAHPSRGCITSILLAARAKLRPATEEMHAQHVGMLNTAGGMAAANDSLLHESEGGVPPAAAPMGRPVTLASSSADVAGPSPSPADDHGGVQPTSDALHYGITACFVLGSVAIALAVDDLGLVLKVVGATGSTTVSYILPGATYVRVCPRHRRGIQWWGALGMLIAGCVIMPLSLTLDFT